jgi:hypothetical protein
LSRWRIGGFGGILELSPSHQLHPTAMLKHVLAVAFALASGVAWSDPAMRLTQVEDSTEAHDSTDALDATYALDATEAQDANEGQDPTDAEDPTEPPPEHATTPARFEITPFVGFRMGGDFEVDETDRDVDIEDSRAFALALNWRIDEASQYELFLARQPTELETASALGTIDLDVDYLHIGGTVAASTPHLLQPYLIGTLGATLLRPDAPAVGDESHFSISLGGGLRIPVRRNFSLRLEARGYVSFVDTDSAIFCRSDEEGALCAIRARGSAFVQYELLGGAAFAF